MLKAYTGYNPCGCGPNNYNLLPIPCNTGCQEDIGCIPIDAKCVTYTGENLNNIGGVTGENLEELLIKIDAVIGTGGEIDYSTYDTACLSTFGTVATQSQFVATISNFVCDTRDNFNTFVNTTYANFVTNTTNAINQILLPGTTGCASFVIPNGSTIQQIIQLIVNRICTINTFIDISTVNWSSCITALTTPTNIAQGFNEVIRQICLVQDSIPSGTGDTYKVKLDVSDTTEDFLITKLKATPCVTITSITDTDSIRKLQFGLGFTPETYTFDPSYFNVTDISVPGCVNSYNVTLAESIGTVTSVALTTPSIFTPTGSPVTTSGTLGFTLNTQASGLIFAGPTTGTAAPTFRSLVTTDLANQIVTYGKIQNVQPQRILGNSTGSAASTQEITIGDGLEFAGGSLKVIKPLPNCAQFDDDWINTSLVTGAVSGGNLLSATNVSAVTAVSFGTTKSTNFPSQSGIMYKFNQLGELIVRGTIRLTFTITSASTPGVFSILLGNITPGPCFSSFQNTLVSTDNIFLGETQAARFINSYVGLKTDGTIFLEVKVNCMGTPTLGTDIILTLDGTNISVTGI